MAWNQWREEHSGITPDLTSIKLWGGNLARANLSDANLSGANLRDVNLENADLSRAILVEADLGEGNGRLAEHCVVRVQGLSPRRSAARKSLFCRVDRQGISQHDGHRPTPAEI